MSQRAIFDRKNILVTGGAGFIGSHLCDTLVKTGKVICVDNFITGKEENIDHLVDNPYFDFLKHDINEPLDLESHPDLEHFNIRFQGIQEIYHLACPTTHKDYVNLDLDTVLTTSVGTRNILDIAKKYKAKVMHFSSSAIYGDPLNENPIPEEYWGFVDPLAERATYNEGKRFSETLVDVFRDRFHLDAKIMRIFNTYGPRMRLDSGRMIPDFVTAALHNKNLTVYGEENATDTYCFISDCIEAAIRFMNSETRQEVLNIGNPETRPIKYIAEKVIALTESKSKIEYHEPLPFIKKSGVPDITKAKEILGWFPIVPLNKGLEETIKYMQATSKILSFKEVKL